MIRFCCCLALSCFFTACVPPKATEVADATSPAPVRNPTPADPVKRTNEMPPLLSEGGMKLPPVQGLPDRRDMTPTTAPASGGGVIATPPTADRKPVNE